MRSLFALLVLLAVPAAGDTRKEETVSLDAAEKHIVRTEFHDEKAVTLSGPEAGGWRLYAGAAIDARRIDLRMRNIRGEVTFRADWTRIANMLDRSRRERLPGKLE